MTPSPPFLFKLVAVVAVEPLFLIGVLDIEKGSVLFEYEKIIRFFKSEETDTHDASKQANNYKK